VLALHVTVALDTGALLIRCERTPPFVIMPYCPEIVAVNVTDWPYTEGFVPDVTTVLVVALFTWG
jgi:hypothetical protein